MASAATAHLHDFLADEQFDDDCFIDYDQTMLYKITNEDLITKKNDVDELMQVAYKLRHAIVSYERFHRENRR